jgi:hypothetical protein
MQCLCDLLLIECINQSPKTIWKLRGILVTCSTRFIFRNNYPPMSFRKLEYILASSIAGFPFIVYIVTLCPTVNFIDSGELVTACATMGIAHPTGYPLFTLIGWIVAHLPLGWRVIYQLNLLAALECSAALFFFFRFLVFLLNESSMVRRIKQIQPSGTVAEDTIYGIFLPAICGTAALAFSGTYWSGALSIEVHPLHVLFLGILFFLFTKSIDLDLKSDHSTQGIAKQKSYWFGFAYLLGLSFTNHITSIFLAPAFLYLFFSVNRFSPGSWKKLLKLGPFFLLGLSLYAYVLIRGMNHPLMNWGNPENIERLLFHMTGRQYRGLLFTSAENATTQALTFFKEVGPQLGYAPLALAAIGVWRLVKEAKKLFLFSLLLFLGCILFAMNYNIPDIDSYFLLAYFAIALWIAWGVKYLVKLSSWRSVRKGVAIGLAIVSLFPLMYNYSTVDESKNTWVEDYVYNMFASLEPNAILITPQWDYITSPAYYLQVVENIRPDVIVLDQNFLQRPWYLTQIAMRFPGAVKFSRTDSAAFFGFVEKIDHDIPFDTTDLRIKYTNLVTNILRSNYSNHPMYVTQEIEPKFFREYFPVPSGLAYRLFRDSLFHHVPMPAFTYNATTREDYYATQLRTSYAQAYTDDAIYVYSFGNRTRALEEVNRALEILPNFELALMMKEQFLLLR